VNPVPFTHPNLVLPLRVSFVFLRGVRSEGFREGLLIPDRPVALVINVIYRAGFELGTPVFSRCSLVSSLSNLEVADFLFTWMVLYPRDD